MMDPGDQRPTRARIRVVVSDARGRTIDRGLASWLSRVAPKSARGTVSVAIVSDARVRALNRHYRRIDRPTDVLSFPASSTPRRTPRTRSPRKHVIQHSAFTIQNSKAAVYPASPAVASFLGDIVIARGVALRQAREAGHSAATEMKVLALHGLLHLLGYDHERDNGAMARLERKLRRRGGLREGLIERR